MKNLSSIEEAIQHIRLGNVVILIDDETRENEGDFVVAAEHATPETINFMATYGRGLICLPLLPQDFERLQIPMMTRRNRSRFSTAFGVSFEAAKNVATGISAQDRAETIKVAIDLNSAPDDIVMPGHMFPLKARTGGVLERPGHTEGAVDLARLAGLKPAAVVCEIMNTDGTMARQPELLMLAEKHNLCVVSIADLIRYRMRHEILIQEVASAKLPIKGRGQFIVKTFRSLIDDQEHLALIRENTDFSVPPLVRLHSECLTGDVLNSARCDCGHQLDLALDIISEQGGVLLYLRQEGRGIGLANKIKAYALQDQGLDTVEANHHLGFSADQRDYGLAMQILKQLNVDQLRLLTNNPQKVRSLEHYGLVITERIALETQPTPDNLSYLKTKREKLGHLLNKVS